MLHIPQAPLGLSDLTGIAVKAGFILRDNLVSFGMKREVKEDGTPVTDVDTRINDLVIEEIRRISNEVDIRAEERDDPRESPWQIACDPCDGTFPYGWGMPVSTFMIGLLYKSTPVMGVIYDPFQHRIYSAERGKGAMMNEKSLKVATAGYAVDHPIVGYCSWPGCKYNMLKVCQYLEERGVTLINFCSVGYVETLVANGEFAGSIFPGYKHHDTAPGHIIVEEAGGLVTDIFGNPHTYQNGEIEGHIMSNGRIHDLLVEAVRACN